MEGKIDKYFPDRSFGKIKGADEKLYDFDKADLRFPVSDVKKGMEVSFAEIPGRAKAIYKLQSIEKNISKSADWFLPEDTRMFLKEVGEKVDNYTLAQNHYLYKVEKEKKLKFEPLIYKYVDSEKSKVIKMSAVNEIIQLLIKRNAQITKSFWKEDYLQFSYKPDISLIIGTGSESPYTNVSIMTLHHIYGLPYIPASALKGVIRGYYIRKEFNGDEKVAMHDETFKEIFGCGAGEDAASNSSEDENKVDENIDGTAKAGGIIFLDAYPESVPEFYYEMFSPHYQEYYKNKNAEPTDYGNVIPLAFPAIKNTSFQIIIGAKSKDTQKHLPLFKSLIPEALAVLGVGGKTAIGYGVGDSELSV